MTEKQYAPSAKEKKMSTKKVESPVAEAPKKVEAKENKTEEKKVEEKKTEVKQPVKVTKVKKDLAVVNANNSKVSLKYAISICKFIKGKRIGDAIRDLEAVVVKKKAVPMTGEYAHKKSVKKYASGAGKYPVNAAKAFLVLVKSLLGNANANDINEPVITECIANKAPKPMGRFGRWERKRCHIKLVAREIKVKENKAKTEEKK